MVLALAGDSTTTTSGMELRSWSRAARRRVSTLAGQRHPVAGQHLDAAGQFEVEKNRLDSGR